MDPIATAAHPRRVTFDDGSHVLVRRVRTTIDTRIKGLVKLTDGDLASEQAYFVLLARYAIVGSEGLKAFETGEPLGFSADPHPVLGRIASEDIVDAVGERTSSKINGLACVVSAAIGVKPGDVAGERGLSEEQRGN